MKLKNLLVPLALLAAMIMSACITLPEDEPTGSDATNTPEATTTTESPTTTTGTPGSTATTEGLEVVVEETVTVGTETTVVVTTAGGDPAANAEVTVNGEQAGTTDSEGKITITIPGGVDKIMIKARFGASEAEKQVTVTQQTKLKVWVQGQANPGETAIIVVKTPEGTPAEGAEVTVEDEEVGTTGSDGKIEVTVPDDVDRIRIKVTFDGMERTTQKVVTEPHLDVLVSVDVEVKSTVTVTVRRPDGSAAEGADVTVNGESAGTTDAQGQVIVNISVESDVLVVEARLDDLQGNTEADVSPEPTPEATMPPTPGTTSTPGVEPTAPASEELNIELNADLTQGGLITLTVTDSEGNPVEGATVSLNGQTLGTTDANGQMQFQVPAVLEFRFEAHANGSVGTLVIDLDG